MKLLIVFVLALVSASMAASSKNMKQLNALLPHLDEKNTEKGPVECIACLTLVNWLLELIQDTFGPEEIIQSFLDFCETTAWPETCTNFVNDHLVDIVDTIWGHSPSALEVCEMIQIC